MQCDYSGVELMCIRGIVGSRAKLEGASRRKRTQALPAMQLATLRRKGTDDGFERAFPPVSDIPCDTICPRVHHDDLYFTH
jgi:hypothetical protein